MRIRLRGSCSWLHRRLCYLSRRGWVTLTLQIHTDHTFISSVWSIWTSEVFLRIYCSDIILKSIIFVTLFLIPYHEPISQPYVSFSHSHSLNIFFSSAVLCSERVGQITKTYHDIEAVTHLLEEVRDTTWFALQSQTYWLALIMPLCSTSVMT